MADTPPPARILVVDDDAAVRALLRECFALEGYEVVEAENGQGLRTSLAGGQIQLVTLDLNLGGEDGLALAREIRAEQNVPIVMITGKGDTIDRVVGLELGADDYIVKPFHVREVLARVRAVLRRYGAGDDTLQRGAPGAGDSGSRDPGDERLAFDGWMLNVGRRELKSDGGEIRDLTTAEFDLCTCSPSGPAVCCRATTSWIC